MSTGYTLTPAQNGEIIKKLASTSEAARTEAVQTINNFLMIRAHETGYCRKYFQNVTGETGIRVVDPETKFYVTTDDDKPAMMYYVQPDFGDTDSLGDRAVTISPYGTPRRKRFTGLRYTETFDTLTTPVLYQNVMSLYTYPYDIVEYFENKLTKTLLDLEDTLFFRLILELMALNSSSRAAMNIYPVDRGSFTVTNFSHFKDQHTKKRVPAARMLVHYSLFNEIERTPALTGEGLLRDGLMGNLKVENGVYKMNEIVVNTDQYVYFSLDVASYVNGAEPEADQFRIDLSLLSAAALAAPTNVAAYTSADRTLIYNWLIGIGYRYIGTAGGGAGQIEYVELDSYTPTIPSTAAETYVIGKKFYRTYLLPQQEYFGHFDLFLKDAETIVEKKNKFLNIRTEEDLILTAKNPYAVTAMDVWSGTGL